VFADQGDEGEVAELFAREMIAAAGEAAHDLAGPFGADRNHDPALFGELQHVRRRQAVGAGRDYDAVELQTTAAPETSGSANRIGQRRIERAGIDLIFFFSY
jgi:hypothetical protein